MWRRMLPIVIGLVPGVVARHLDRRPGQPGLAEALHLCRAAAADPASGGGLSAADSDPSDRSAWCSAAGSACCIR